MNTRQIQDEILRIKKEKNVCILAHAYQSHDIWDIADYVGDSFGLSQKAAQSDADTILMCGVRFMAETVKILAPQKKVFLANPNAGCPMAEQISPAFITKLKEQYPEHTVVAYINTTAELKTFCDVCVTSSSAVKVVKAIQNNKILFIPDCNIGAWAQQ
ncbi:MAG: quinolinate synthase NadA, partial [Bacteroidales bacterium]|nr:quinolinate synthase NadA [Bacteroidales bacterium]